MRRPRRPRLWRWLRGSLVLWRALSLEVSAQVVGPTCIFNRQDPTLALRESRREPRLTAGEGRPAPSLTRSRGGRQGWLGVGAVPLSPSLSPSLAGLFFLDLNSPPTSEPDRSRLFKDCGKHHLFTHLLARGRMQIQTRGWWFFCAHAPRHTKSLL